MACRSWTWTLSVADVEAQLVGGAVGDARPDAAAGQEQGESVRVMVAAQVLAGGGAALAERRAAELAAPDDQRRSSKPRCFRSRSARRPAGPSAGTCFAGPRGCPRRGRCRGSPSPSRRAARNARLARPAGGPAGSCWRSRRRPAGRRTASRIRLGSREMSITSGTAVCMRKASSYWAIRVRVSGLPSSSACNSLRSRSASRLCRRKRAIHARGIGDVQHRIALRTALHALEDRGQKTAAPEAIAGAGMGAAGDQDDEAGQVLALRAEAIGHPRAHRRPAKLRRAGEQQQLRRGVVELVGEHRLDEAQVVGDAGKLRQGLRHPVRRIGRAGRTSAACRAASARRW